MNSINAILPIIVTLSSLWVYVDASKNKIGNSPNGGLLNIGGAGWWGVLCLLLWIIAFPLYLMKRNKLIALAKAHPSEPTNRNLKIGVFSIIAIVSIWWNIWGVKPSLPDCNDPQAVDTLKSAIIDTPVYKMLGVDEIQIADISERPSTTSDKRICRASLHLGSNYGSQVIYYSIDWQNKETGEFWVQTIQGE